MIHGLSEAEDTWVLQEALKTEKQEITIGMAGTAMRFLTAYLAYKKGTYILDGAPRMRERPIGILVEALRRLGAHIHYLGKEGNPPLKIGDAPLHGGTIEIDGSVSSQFSSALLLIAPLLEKGIQLKLTGLILSEPYIKMTLALMKDFGIHSQWTGDTIVVPQQNYIAKTDQAEPDWSAAAYWYQMAALAKEADILLKGLKADSLQGDHQVAKYFETFGVYTTFTTAGAQLQKKKETIPPQSLRLDLSGQPDLAQSLAVTCVALGMDAQLSGLYTLPIKETDRLLALKNELEKVGAKVTIKEQSVLEIKTSDRKAAGEIHIDTYGDHRMAMAFAPLSLHGSITIKDTEVVKKSYPSFWEDLKNMGFELIAL